MRTINQLRVTRDEGRGKPCIVTWLKKVRRLWLSKAKPNNYQYSDHHCWASYLSPTYSVNNTHININNHSASLCLGALCDKQEEPGFSSSLVPHPSLLNKVTGVTLIEMVVFVIVAGPRIRVPLPPLSVIRLFLMSPPFDKMTPSSVLFETMQLSI